VRDDGLGCKAPGAGSEGDSAPLNKKLQGYQPRFIAMLGDYPWGLPKGTQACPRVRPEPWRASRATL
jgi:hypothetical protein